MEAEALAPVPDTKLIMLLTVVRLITSIYTTATPQRLNNVIGENIKIAIHLLLPPFAKIPEVYKDHSLIVQRKIKAILRSQLQKEHI